MAHVYLAGRSAAAAVRGATLAHVTGVKEVTFVDCASSGPGLRCSLAAEPELLAIGPAHLAVAAQGKVVSPRSCVPSAALGQHGPA